MTFLPQTAARVECKVPSHASFGASAAASNAQALGQVLVPLRDGVCMGTSLRVLFPARIRQHAKLNDFEGGIVPPRMDEGGTVAHSLVDGCWSNN